MTTKQTLHPRLAMIALTLLASIALLFVYAVLHEGGHALVGLMLGGTIQEFHTSIFDFGAHVTITGMSGGPGAQAWFNIAGMALPLAVWVAFLLLAPRGGNPLLEVIKYIGSMGIFNSLLVWILFPILEMAGVAPAGEDVIKFLRNSGIPPLLAAAVFLLLYAALWMLFFRRVAPLRGWRDRLLKLPTEEWTGPAARRTLAAMGALAALAAGVAALANQTAWQPGSIPGVGQPPAGYTLAGEMSAAGHAEAVTLAPFTVSEAGEVGVFLSLRAMNCEYIDIRLLGPDGYDASLMHGEGYTANLDTVAYSETLAPGAYATRLDARCVSGNIQAFLMQ